MAPIRQVDPLRVIEGQLAPRNIYKAFRALHDMNR